MSVKKRKRRIAKGIHGLHIARILFFKIDKIIQGILILCS